MRIGQVEIRNGEVEQRRCTVHVMFAALIRKGRRVKQLYIKFPTASRLLFIQSLQP